MKASYDMTSAPAKGSAKALVIKFDLESGRFLGLQGLAGNARQRRRAIRTLRQKGQNVKVLCRH